MPLTGYRLPGMALLHRQVGAVVSHLAEVITLVMLFGK
jgi:hypothetical protein